MGAVHIGLNAEYSRSSDKPFEWAVEEAAKMGYEYFEPMVHFGRELMSEAGYFHTVSMFDDPFRIKEACDAAGLKISGLQSHGPLGRPDVHGEYIKLAIRTAAEIGVPVINTDEGHQGQVDHRGRGLRADQVHAAGGGLRGRTPRREDRPGTARPVLARRPTGWTASTTWSTRPRSASTSTRATPTCAATTSTPGSTGSSSGWSTCTPRTSPSSIPTPNAAR